MKKNSLLALAMLSILTISGCGNTSSTSVQPKSSVEIALEKIQKGFKTNGVINETARYLNGPNGAYTGDSTSVEYEYEFVFENREKNGCQRAVARKQEDGSIWITEDDIYIEGEDGHVYFDELTYRNTIEMVEVVDSNENQVNYAYYFDNPFTHISVSDFTYVDDNKYTLDSHKASYIASSLFGQIDDIFYNVIKKADVIIENDEIKSITLVPNDLLAYDNYDSNLSIYFLLEASTVMNFSEVGTASVKVHTPKVHDGTTHTKLDNALEATKNNYTLTVNWNQTNDGEVLDPVVSKYYFADDVIFMKFDNSTEDIVENSDLFVKVNADESLTAYGYDLVTNTWTTKAAIDNGLSAYNSMNVMEIQPIIHTVAAELFTYVTSDDTYYICDELVSFIGAECFIPPIELVSDPYFNGYGSECKIKLDSTGNIDTILIQYTVDNSFMSRSVDCELKFENIGTTTLPYGITL